MGFNTIIEKKIIAGSDIAQINDNWKDKTIVFTNGCFDIIHSGHINYLSRARDLGDKLIIGLNSDDSVRRLKGPSRPINNAKDRAYLLAAFAFVDAIVIFDEDTPFELISIIKPSILVKGGDYTKETIVGADLVENSGGKVVVLPFLPGYSSTNIIEKILKTDKE